MEQQSRPLEKCRGIHSPVLPQEEIQSNFQALIIFVPLAIKYLARHFTIGSYIRLRRFVLRRLGRVYFL